MVTGCLILIMKDFEWCAMDEEMDFYLRRCVKEWADGCQPPADGRARLLHAAGQAWLGAPAHRLGVIAYLWTLVSNRPLIELRSERARPYTQSRTWSLYIATQWRLAN